MNLSKVLLVEDHRALQLMITDSVRLHLGKDTIVLVAGTVSEADELFSQHCAEIDLILMDTHLGGKVTTFEFTKKISKVFGGMIVATSVEDDNHAAMLSCGCTHSCNKGDLFNFLMNLKK